MQIRELSCKTLQIPIKTIKPKKTGKKSKKKTGNKSPKKMQPQGNWLNIEDVLLVMRHKLLAIFGDEL